MPLYGHEIDDCISPKEAGLGIFVKMDKEDFIGKKALVEKGPLTRKRVGLKVTGRGIIREHQPVYIGDQQIGMTTSGTHCPYLGNGCGGRGARTACGRGSGEASVLQTKKVKPENLRRY